jgi:subtilase family serine protease
LIAAALTVALAGLTVPAQAQARRSLQGSVAGWANAAHRVGSTPATQGVAFRVYLNTRNSAAAAAYATAVTTPGSKYYGKFLTPAQYNARYAPTAADVSSVKSWLASQGFKVGAVGDSNKFVAAAGTVAQAAKAFQTSFATYKYAGRNLRANNRPLTVPSTVPAIEAVTGLDQSGALVTPASPPGPPAVFMNGTPCSAYWGDKTVAADPTADGTVLPSAPTDFAPCGYTPSQLQGAYGMSGAISSGNDGHGVTVAIIDAFSSPTILADANKYSSLHGLPSLNGLYSEHIAPGTQQRAANKKMDPAGWSGEQTLDVEAVHTMAPGAKILYVGAPNNGADMTASMNWVVSRHAADIITNSYGNSSEALPPGQIKPQNDLFIQAALTGISIFFSSGDNSDETNGVAGATPTPDWPASSPWVTAVGGTSLGIAQDNSRIFELGWATEKSTLNTTTGAWNAPFYLYGAGGGTSRLFGQPSYQAGVVPSSMSQTYGGAAMRVVPDVSALADPTTGMLIGQTQVFPDGHSAYAEYRIGGTSLASPLYAGMFALAVQKAGHEFGLANPVLYKAPANDITTADDSTYTGAVRVDFKNGVDATGGYVYSARYFDNETGLTIHVANGYDDITGVGSPTGQAWLDYVSSH